MPWGQARQVVVILGQLLVLVPPEQVGRPVLLLAWQAQVYPGELRPQLAHLPLGLLRWCPSCRGPA